MNEVASKRPSDGERVTARTVKLAIIATTNAPFTMPIICCCQTDDTISISFLETKILLL